MKRSVINAFLLVLFWFEFSFKTSKSFTILRCPCRHFFFFLLRAFIPMSYFLLPREFLFCRKLSSFAMTSYFSAASIFLLPWFFIFILLRAFFFPYDLFFFAVRIFLSPRAFYFCRELSTFCREYFSFAASFFLVPRAVLFCRELYSFSVTLVGHRSFHT